MGKGGGDRPLANSGAPLHTQSAARPVQGSLGPASRRRPVVCRPRHLDPGGPLSSALLFIASLDAWESLPARSWGPFENAFRNSGKTGGQGRASKISCTGAIAPGQDHRREKSIRNGSCPEATYRARLPLASRWKPPASCPP